MICAVLLFLIIQPLMDLCRAMEGLKNLYELSGVNNLSGEWMISVFRQWKGFIVSIMVSFIYFYSYSGNLRLLLLCALYQSIIGQVD